METIRVGDIVIAMTCKDIKHVHLSVHRHGGGSASSRPPAPAPRSHGPMRSRSLGGFVINGRSCAVRHARL